MGKIYFFGATVCSHVREDDLIRARPSHQTRTESAQLTFDWQLTINGRPEILRVLLDALMEVPRLAGSPATRLPYHSILCYLARDYEAWRTPTFNLLRGLGSPRGLPCERDSAQTDLTTRCL